MRLGRLSVSGHRIMDESDDATDIIFHPSLIRHTHTHTGGSFRLFDPRQQQQQQLFYFLDPVAAFIAFDRSLDVNILHILLVISTVKLNLSNVQNPNTIFSFLVQIFQCKSSSIIRLSFFF
jgi:hypothetical protein